MKKSYFIILSSLIILSCGNSSTKKTQNDLVEKEKYDKEQTELKIEFDKTNKADSILSDYFFISSNSPFLKDDFLLYETLCEVENVQKITSSYDDYDYEVTKQNISCYLNMEDIFDIAIPFIRVGDYYIVKTKEKKILKLNDIFIETKNDKSVLDEFEVKLLDNLSGDSDYLLIIVSEKSKFKQYYTKLVFTEILRFSKDDVINNTDYLINKIEKITLK